jgi:uncharacterized membrane protein YgcG
MSDETEPAYPAQGEFQLRVRQVKAVYYDGTLATAHEILAWVFRSGSRGHLKDGYADQGPDLLYIGERQVTEKSWVVQNGTKFEVWSDQDFRQDYEPILKGIVMRSPGGSGETIGYGGGGGGSFTGGGGSGGR